MYTPTDVAFSVLKNKDDVRKFLPLIIPAAMAGYGAYRGIKNLQDNKITDPVVGMASTEGNDSFGSNLLEFGTGAAQGFGFGAGAKVGSKVLGAVGRKTTAKRSAASAASREAEKQSARQAARSQAARSQAGAPSHGPMSARQNLDYAMYMSPRGRVGSYPRSMGNQAAAQVGNRRGASELLHGASQGLTTAGKARIAPVGAKRLVGGTLAAGAGLAGAGLVAGALGTLGAGGGGGSGMGGGGSGMGGQQHQQGQFNLAGQQSGGVQNLQNVGVGQTGREQIWQQGGSGTFGTTQKGEIMTFTNREGNEMLLKTLNLFEKAVCPKCDKKDCKCDEEKKADDGDKKKKPAHGMVIVIGSKNSGPGPSTDGKRDSKD